MAESKPATYDAAGPHVVPAISERVRPDARLIALLSLGHFVIDLNQGALAAILPFIKSSLHLSYAALGTIVLGGNVTSSLIQPLFGYLADQAARRWILPLAVAISGVGLSLTGVAPSYATVVLAVFAMGFGAAAYHPEGYKTVTGVAGSRKATAVSWFSLGGNTGIALGPLTITALVTTMGLGGSLGMLVPSLVVAALLFASLPRITNAGGGHAAAARAARGTNMPRAMALLVLVVMIRSWTQLGFTTFIPLYYLDTLKSEPQMVGQLLFVFLGGGALGTIVAGPLADRWGPRPFMLWVFLGVTPLALAFLHLSGVLAFVALGLMGAVMVSTFTASVILAQQYLPRNAGMATGLIVGFASGTAGLGVTLLGWLADRHGLMLALWISALMPLAGFVAAWFLPSPRANA